MRTRLQGCQVELMFSSDIYKYTLSYRDDRRYEEKWSGLRALWEFKTKDLPMKEIGG